ncbi:hypothetical protein LguiB_032380 [Lonicera macranthoides]
MEGLMIMIAESEGLLPNWNSNPNKHIDEKCVDRIVLIGHYEGYVSEYADLNNYDSPDSNNEDGRRKKLVFPVFDPKTNMYKIEALLERDGFEFGEEEREVDGDGEERLRNGGGAGEGILPSHPRRYQWRRYFAFTSTKVSMAEVRKNTSTTARGSQSGNGMLSG